MDYYTLPDDLASTPTMAFVNGGGVRSDLIFQDDDGHKYATYGSLINVQPFGNTAIGIKTNAKQMKEAINLSFSKVKKGHPSTPEGDPTDEFGGFFQVSSNVSLEVNLSDQGNTVTKFTIGDFDVLTANDDDPIVLIGPSFTLTEGGDGYTMFKDCEQVTFKDSEDLSGLDIDILKNYLVKVGTGEVEVKNAYKEPAPTSRIQYTEI